MSGQWLRRLLVELMGAHGSRRFARRFPLSAEILDEMRRRKQ